MKRKICFILQTIILGLIISLSSAEICYAEVDLNALQGYLNAVVSQEQINQSNNPKYADRNYSVETIDPITGNLILRQTDLNLTGKDGLDLSLGRIYNSSQNECDKKVSLWYTVETKLVYIQGYACDMYFFHAETNEFEKYTQYFDNQGDAYYFYLTYQTNADNTMYTLSPYPANYTEYRDVYTVNADNYTDKYSYNKVRYNLGAGWSFTFPSIQVPGYGSEGYFYHDGNGSAYQITGFENSGTCNLEGYQGNDIKLLTDIYSYVNGDGTPSRYKLIDSDLTTTYFGEDGRILGIKDRFNNEIKFWYTNIQINQRSCPLISKIQDSIGRIINFAYTGNDITLTVSAPNETEQLNIKYTRSFVSKNIYKNGSIIETYNYPVLDSVLDKNNRQLLTKTIITIIIILGHQ